MGNVDSDSISSQAESSDHYRSRGDSSSLLVAAKDLVGEGPPFRFGWRADGSFGLERERQVAALSLLPAFIGSIGELLGKGGEHIVHFSSDRSSVLKFAHPDSFGFVIDEESLMDSRTLRMRPMLKHRPSLPSEYLFRWALLGYVFGLVTNFEGTRNVQRKEVSIVISQPFIGIEENDDDVPEWDEVVAFLMAFGFQPVDDAHVAYKEIKGAVWYRQMDGVLISDVFPRNFKRDKTGAVIPIDLVVNIVPPGASKILPQATEPFTLPPAASLL